MKKPIAILLCLLLGSRALQADCDVTVGDQIMAWVQNDAARRSRTLAEADYPGRVFNYLQGGYEDQHTRIQAISQGLDAIATQITKAERELPSDEVGAAVARQHSAQELLTQLFAVRADLDAVAERHRAMVTLPSFEEFQQAGLHQIGRATLVEEFQEIGAAAASTLASKFGFSFAITVDSAGNVTPGSVNDIATAADGIALAVNSYIPGAFAVYYLAKFVLFAFLQNACDSRVQEQMNKVRQAFQLLMSKLQTPEQLYALYGQAHATELARFQDETAKVTEATAALDRRWRDLVASNALRTKTAAAVLTAEKIRMLQDGFGRDSALTSILRNAAIDDVASDIASYNSFLARQERSTLRACQNVAGVRVLEDYADSLTFAEQAYRVYRAEAPLAPLQPLLEASLGSFAAARQDIQQQLQSLAPAPCAPLAARRGQLDRSSRLARAALAATSVKSRRGVASVGRSRQALIAPPAPPPPQEVPWSVCALVTADGRTYQCGGGGTPYTNNFGNRTGNPQNDILFSTNDAGYAADNRRVSLEIDQVNRNLDDRIRQMGERVDAARQALPDWLTRNGQALDAGIQVTGARTDQQAADREQFTRANATAITDAATTTETFIQSPFDRSRTTAFLASVGGVNASLPDLPASALPPDAPALRGITANDRIYGSSSTFFAKQLQRERAKVDEQLQAGGALRRLALEELAVAEQFGASGTEAGAQVAQALLKDSAAARFAGTGRLPALTLTTVGLDGTIGDRLIGDPTVLPADALIVRVRQFEADSDAFDLRASGIRAALTPDVPNYLRRLDAFNVAERTAAIGRRTFTKGDVAEAHMQMSMGTRVLDFVTQFVPLVNEGRSIAETLTGRNGVTGEDLGAVQRTVVGVGIVVGGLGEDLVGAGKLVRGLKDASSPTIERLTFAFGDRLSRISGYIKEITGASLRRSTHLEEQLAAREFGLTDQALNRIVDEGRPFFDTARAKSEMLSALDTRPEFVQMKNNTELVYMMERSKVDPAFAAAVAAGTDDAVIALAVSGETKTMATVYEIEKTAKVDDVVKKRLLERQYRDGTSGSYGQRFYEMLRPPPPPR